MELNYETSLNRILAFEGGYVDHPHDPGGATNQGVTLRTFRHFYNRHATKEDLKNITRDQVSYIYKRGYWDKCRCSQLPSGIDLVVFDQAVNSGPTRSIRWLQEALGAGVVTDGIIGPQTLTAAQSCDRKRVISEMCTTRLVWLSKLRTWQHFKNGWITRIGSLRSIAFELSTQPRAY